MEVWIARTGYTGEAWGYEIFIHPDSASSLWNLLLEVGEDLGIVPAGLGARDSLRTEAGLPLYGRELAGPHQIDPLEAGFGGYVKLHKPFFVGRSEMVERSRRLSRRIVRFRLLHRGGRLVHPGDLVIHGRTQQVIGWVTSAAPNGEGIQVGMALVESRLTKVDTPIGIISSAQIQALKEIPPKSGNRWPVQQEGVILNRFPGRG
ncbi:MAG TPA: aminomethyl transferase family protein [Candidatus Latescibacteria bacterium]|nr:aminomethyl transferase family protein [Candidatus Latescibacterota bacterium]